MVRVTTPLRFAELGDWGIPLGWQAHEIAARYRWLGGQNAIFDNPPLSKWARQHEWNAYKEALDRLPTGVRANDAACTELAVQYFEINAYSSYSGYKRAKIARALWQVSLTEAQRDRLNRHFLSLIGAKFYANNFEMCVRLFTHTIDENALSDLKQLIIDRHPYRFISPEYAWQGAKGYRWIREAEATALAKPKIGRRTSR